MFKLYLPFKPIPPQKECAEKITKRLKEGKKHTVLLGVTGSGKTFVMSLIIELLQKPTLIISHNKTLAAQLYQEFKEFFPENAVHYFVSYYDYYQPEAYIPETDTYIEKDAKINEVIDRLRHETIQSVVSRNDVIVVASVSCIYNIGSPEYYHKVSLQIKEGQKIKRKEFLECLVKLQYQRNEINFIPGSFRLRENMIEIFSPTGKEILRVFLGKEKILKIEKAEYKREIRKPEDALEKIPYILVRESRFKKITQSSIFPAKFWLTPEEKLDLALANIKLELQERLEYFKRKKRIVEYERLKRRTLYDIEMIKEIGWCHGIENYSRHLEFRKPGSPPYTLLDYFPEDFLVFIDESHQTIPQIRGMYEGDKSRKETLVDYGFRLPSALDNRPLKFKEFLKKIHQVVYVSATPGEWERKKAGKKGIVELLIRPTGLLDPKIEIRDSENQIKDVIKEIEKSRKKNERVLVLTLTKREAEEIAEYLEEKGIKSAYLHSEIKTLERPEFLKKLRQGYYDVLVGINLLREGLDLPEVALILILDADKEGFLRNETTLIQIIGRAARHLNGRAILYAKEITKSMKKAIEETKRRREIQKEYNKKHSIVPRPIVKEIREWEFAKKEEEKGLGLEEKIKRKDIKFLKKEMEKAIETLDFERAAQIRDEIKKLMKD